MKDLPATIDVICGGREEIFATAGWQLIAKFSHAVRTKTRWTGNGDLNATEEFVRTHHVLMRNAEWCIVRVSTNSEANSLTYFSLNSLLAHLEAICVHPETAEAVKNAALHSVWSESTIASLTGLSKRLGIMMNRNRGKVSFAEFGQSVGWARPYDERARGVMTRFNRSLKKLQEPENIEGRPACLAWDGGYFVKKLKAPTRAKDAPTG